MQSKPENSDRLPAYKFSRPHQRYAKCTVFFALTRPSPMQSLAQKFSLLSISGNPVSKLIHSRKFTNAEKCWKAVSTKLKETKGISNKNESIAPVHLLRTLVNSTKKRQAIKETLFVEQILRFNKRNGILLKRMSVENNTQPTDPLKMDFVPTADSDKWVRWEEFREKETVIGNFTNIDDGEHPNNAPDEGEHFGAYFDEISESLGFGSGSLLSPFVLGTLWYGRTKYGEEGPELNWNYVQFAMVHREQSLGTICSKFFFHHFGEKWSRHDLFTPDKEMIRAISVMSNERLVMISSFDEIFYGRTSSYYCNHRCSICFRTGQHWSNNCYWYFTTIQRDAVRKLLGRCAGCDQPGCSIGRNYHKDDEGCGNCKSRNHRTWTCNARGREEVEIVLRTRLVLSAYVTRSWSLADLRTLLDHYCVINGSPQLQICSDSRVHQKKLLCWNLDSDEAPKFSF